MTLGEFQKEICQFCEQHLEFLHCNIISMTIKHIYFQILISVMQI